MSYDYSEDQLIQKSTADLLENELAGKVSMLSTRKCWVPMVHSVET